MQEVYDVDSQYPGFRDVHADNLRPSVIVRMIPDVGMINLLTRTTNLEVEGVDHPEIPEWSLDQPGKFGKEPVQTLEARLFNYPLVNYFGILDDETWNAVVAMWEAS